jgi:hypothetical protein
MGARDVAVGRNLEALQKIAAANARVNASKLKVMSKEILPVSRTSAQSTLTSISPLMLRPDRLISEAV